MTRDKRRTHRMSIELPVSYQSPYSKGMTSTAVTIDISVNGLCVRTKEPLKPKEKLGLNVELPNEQTLHIHVEVVRFEQIQQMAQLGGFHEYKVALKIQEPMQGDEKTFVRFYADLLKNKFGKTSD